MGLATAKMERSDRELIQLVLNGNQTAFTEIVNRYKDKIAGSVHGMLGVCQEADDVGQEVFVRFYRSLKNFRGDANLGTYLTRIAINLSLNEIKKRKRRTIFSYEEWFQTKLSVKSENENFENSEIVNKALQKIDAKYRAVIVLRLVENYSTEETANILKLPVGTVLSRLARGQKKLKQILTPYMEGKK